MTVPADTDRQTAMRDREHDPGLREPPPVNPEHESQPLVQRPLPTVEKACMAVDSWGRDYGFGVHDIARVLRAEVERLIGAASIQKLTAPPEEEDATPSPQQAPREAVDEIETAAFLRGQNVIIRYGLMQADFSRAVSDQLGVTFDAAHNAIHKAFAALPLEAAPREAVGAVPPSGVERAKALIVQLNGGEPLDPNDADIGPTAAAITEAEQAAERRGRLAGLAEAASFVQQTHIAPEQPSLSRTGLLCLFRDCLVSRLLTLATKPPQPEPEG